MPLTTETIQTALQEKAVLILFSNGDGLRNEFDIAYKKASAESSDIVFMRIDPAAEPELAAQYEIGDKPVMLALYKGEILARRSRPWGSDVPLAIEMLKTSLKADLPKEIVNVSEEKQLVVDTKPFKVTDATFQKEVVDHGLPVLVDFWAEWCGPCRMVNPILEKLAAEYAGQIRIAKVNVDENPGLSQTFRVMSIPTIMIFKEHHLIFNQPGALPEAAFRDLIQQTIALDMSKAHEGHNHDDHDHDHDHDHDEE